jgi:iron complex outermembrane receptor protein
MKRFKQKYLYVSLALSAFLTAGSAQAEIEEITVTANKREQSLQDVPLTVSVTSGEVIQQSSIVDLIDLQTAVPALRVNQLQNSAQTNFTIRGFGNGANNPGIEPSVLVVVDGVPRSRSSSTMSDLPNIERIEVLSGPQSTLFGKNASAGVISVTTKAPEDEMGGLIEATIGNYGSQIIKGTVTGPTSIENLTFRISASTNENDGNATNLTDNSPLNNRDRNSLRAQLQWNAADDLSARLIYDKDKIDEVCCVTGPLFRGVASATSDNIAGAENSLPLDATPWDREIYMNFKPYNVLENEGLSLHIEKDLGYATFTSITSDRNTSMMSDFDADFSGADLVGEQMLHYEFDTFTQEFRLTSDSDSEMQWSLGAFYSDEETYFNRTVKFGEDIDGYANSLISGLTDGENDLDTISEAVAAGALQKVYMTAMGQTENEAKQSIGAVVEAYVGAQAQAQATLPEDFTAEEMAQFQVDAIDATLTDFGQATSTQMRSQFFVPGTGSTGERFDMEAKTVSVFANMEFPLADNWAANIGVNKTWDEKTVVSMVEENVEDFFATLPLAAVDQRLLAVQFFPPFTDYPNDTESGIFKTDDITHTLRLTHDLSDNTKFYASHSTGFKPTSVNLSVNATEKRTALPEHSENIEFGLKHSYDDGYVNIALFNQNIENFQSNTFVGNGFQLVNAGDQRHQGLELDISHQLDEQWKLGLSAMKINAEYERFEDGPCSDVDLPDGTVVFADVDCDNVSSLDENGETEIVSRRYATLTGSTPAGIHDWSANLNAVYSFNVSDAVSSFLRLEYVYESEVAVVENVPAVVSPISIGFNAASYGLDPLAGEGYANIPATRSTKNFNMSIGFNHAPSGVEVMLWGRNLTNHESLLSAFPTTAAPGSFGGYPNAPKTYGLTARASF